MMSEAFVEMPDEEKMMLDVVEEARNDEFSVNQKLSAVLVTYFGVVLRLIFFTIK